MAKPIKHGNKWRVRWFDEAGVRHSAVFDSYREAELAGARVQVELDEIRRGLRPKTENRDRTFADLAGHWLEFRAADKRSKRSDQSLIGCHLLPAFGKLRLVEIGVAEVDAFKARLKVGKKTIHNILTQLISMLNYAVDLGWLAACPNIRKPTISINQHDYRYLRTDAEVIRFLRAAEEEGDHVHALFATAVFTGMRAGELAGLKWSAVNLARRLITVQASYEGPTKSGDVRYVPILDALLPVLQAWRLRGTGDLVFPSETGTMLLPSARIFQDVLHRVLTRAGFPETTTRTGKVLRFITFHGLRHTFASHWMMNGGDIFKLQRIGGWRSFDMVQRYAHLAPDAFAEDYGRMGRAIPTTATARIRDADEARPARAEAPRGSLPEVESIATRDRADLAELAEARLASQRGRRAEAVGGGHRGRGVGAPGRTVDPVQDVAPRAGGAI